MTVTGELLIHAYGGGDGHRNLIDGIRVVGVGGKVRSVCLEHKSRVPSLHKIVVVGY